MMNSCKEVVKILSSGEKLRFRQKFELKAHLFICKHCAAYEKELIALADQLKKNYIELTRTESERVQELERKVLSRLRTSKGEI